jgi:hypothetical protein
MQRVLIVGGVLGLGTAIVFGAAALTATLFPNGTLVAGSWNSMSVNGGWVVGKGGGIMTAPVPVPATIGGGPVIDLPEPTVGPGPS